MLDRILHRSQFIAMERLDKLGQAVSLAIAEQNQRWAWYLPPALADSDLCFSHTRISEILEWITSQHYGFDRFFAWNAIVPIGVQYESLVADRQGHISAIATQLGCGPIRIDKSRIELRPQATELNRVWRERFVAGLHSLIDSS
ncbi:MAG: hypothetical protein JOY66_09660 [Acetobacteraceae bacterium]|nr:hypothetical protein [Acetobacteraceae bacterium]